MESCQKVAKSAQNLGPFSRRKWDDRPDPKNISINFSEKAFDRQQNFSGKKRDFWTFLQKEKTLFFHYQSLVSYREKKSEQKKVKKTKNS